MVLLLLLREHASMCASVHDGSPLLDIWSCANEQQPHHAQLNSMAVMDR